MSAIQTPVKTMLHARMWLMATSANVFLDIQVIIIMVIIVMNFDVQLWKQIFNMDFWFINYWEYCTFQDFQNKNLTVNSFTKTSVYETRSKFELYKLWPTWENLWSVPSSINLLKTTNQLMLSWSRAIFSTVRYLYWKFYWSPMPDVLVSATWLPVSEP